MPQQIEIPGKGIVEFPDGMANDAIAAAIQKNYPDLRQTPHLADTFGNAMVKGATGLADTVINTPENLFKLGQVGFGTLATKFGRSDLAPDVQTTPNRVTDAARKYGVLDDTAEPNTTAGRIVDFTGQVLGGGGVNPAALARSPGLANMGGQVAKALMTGTAGGTAKEVASHYTDSPIGQSIASFLGMMTPAFLPGMRPSSGRAVANALRGVEPQDYLSAQTLQRDAAGMGAPITGAEAIAQTKGASPLTAIQRVIEQSPKGSPIMTNFMTARPEGNRQALDSVTSAMGPLPPSPSSISPALQDAAKAALTDARQTGNAAAEPFYRAAEKQQVPLADWNVLTQDPAVNQAILRVKSQPEWGVSKEPPGSVKLLDAAKRWIDGKLESVQTTNSEKRIWGDANDKIKTTADAASPDYKIARALVAENHKNVVTPMQRSPIGDLAYAKPAPGDTLMREQSNILMPQTPKVLNEQTIQQTVATLQKQNPAAVPDFLRQNLQSIFDETSQKIQSGANQWGGAKYAAVVSGNAQQAKNLQALIESLPNGKQAYSGFRRMLDVMEAQGKREPPGSRTEFNKQISEGLSGGGIGSTTAAVLSPGYWGTVVKDWYDKFRYGSNSKQMATLLTDPESVTKLRALANLAPNDTKATQLVSSLLQSNRDLANKDDLPK